METNEEITTTELEVDGYTLMQIKALFLCLAYEKPWSEVHTLKDLPKPSPYKLIAALHLVVKEVSEFMSFGGEGDGLTALYETLLDTHIRTEKFGVKE